MTDANTVGPHQRKYGVLLALLCIALAIQTVNGPATATFVHAHVEPPVGDDIDPAAY